MAESLQVLLIEGKRKVARCFAVDLQKKGYSREGGKQREQWTGRSETLFP